MSKKTSRSLIFFLRMNEDILKESHVVDKGDNHDFNLGHIAFELYLFKPSKNSSTQFLICKLWNESSG